MMLYDAVNLRIEELKKENNLNQYRLSEESGVPQTTLVSIKRKRSKDVGISNINKICIGVGISLKEFFDSPLFDNLDTEEVKELDKQ